jgi:RNA polymerase sigma factor (sigma-70 family)
MSPRISIRLLAAQSDERLVSLVAQGHERAFETLVARYRDQLLRYCARMGLSEWRAEEVLQQALMKAWLALGSGTEVRHPKSWLYRIVHNAAVNALRGSSEDHAPLTHALGAPVAAQGESDLGGRMAVREALNEVSALPQMQRQVVVLTALEGQTHGQVAGTLGISDDAVRGLLYRARATLRSAAAAVVPQPLIGWISGLGRALPAGDRLVELSGAGGAAGTVGATGVLLKGAVLAVTAGVLVGGAALGPLQHRGARRSVGAVPSPAGARTAGYSRSPAARPGSTSAERSLSAGSPRAGGGGADRAPAPALPVLRHTRGSVPAAPAATTPDSPRAPAPAGSATKPASAGEGGQDGPAGLATAASSGAPGEGSSVGVAAPGPGPGASAGGPGDARVSGSGGESPQGAGPPGAGSGGEPADTQDPAEVQGQTGPIEVQREPDGAGAGRQLQPTAGTGH